MRPPPDLALTGGPIHTLDPDLPSGDTLLVQGDRILAVGSSADLKDGIQAAREVVDLKGRVCLPGFIDSHVHVIGTGLAHFVLDVTSARTLSEALHLLGEARGRVEPGGWLFAQGLAAGLLQGARRRMPRRDELDEAAGDRAVFLSERTGHACSLNTLGIEAIGLPLLGSGVERDESGEPTGVFTGEANTLLSSQADLLFAAQVGYGRILDAAYAEALRSGLTTLHALDGSRSAGDPGVEALVARGQAGAPRVLVYYQTRDVDAALAFGLPRIGGCGACWVDGAFTPHTARLLEPYTDQPHTHGSLYFSDSELLAFFRRAHAAGLQIAVHCVGDGAVEQALQTYEAILEHQPRHGHRHRIEHAELITASQLKRARRLGLVLSIQPAFNHFWRHDGFYPPVLGQERADRVDPVRTILEAGLRAAGGSDSTVTPLSPLLGVHSAVNHSNPAERVEVEPALHLFTSGGAYAAFEEEEKGTLTPGKLADIVVLGASPLEVFPKDLKDIPVEMTIVGGRIAFAAS